MIIKILLYLLLASFSLYANLNDEVDYQDRPNLPSYHERNEQLRNDIDEIILQHIQDYIRRRLTDPRDDVYVSVEDGVVTLNGTVATGQKQIDLLKFARRLRGVTHVVDQLDIWTSVDVTMPPTNPEGPFEVEYNMLQNPFDDRVWNRNTPVGQMALKGKIRAAIEKYEYVTFGVYVNEVILEGYVETGRDREELERRVLAVPGVFRVTNNVQVRNKYPKRSRY